MKIRHYYIALIFSLLCLVFLNHQIVLADTSLEPSTATTDLTDTCLSLPTTTVDFVNTTTSPPIIISEVGWAGSSKSSADEWIELHNLSDRAIDLSSWKIQVYKEENVPNQIIDLTDSTESIDKEDVTINNLVLDSTIPADGYFLYSRQSDSHRKTIVSTALCGSPALILSSDGALSLANSNLGLKLIHQIGDQEIMVDQVLNNKDFAGNNKPKASQVRKLPVTGGLLASSWYTATTSAGFIEGVTDLGTPGLPNISGPVINDFTCSPTKFARRKDLDVSCSGNVINYDNQVVDADINDGELNSLSIQADGSFTFNKMYTDVSTDLDLNLTATSGELSTSQDIHLSGFDVSNKVSINEIYPAPQTSESEWIELENEGDTPVNLSGWSLDDILVGGSKPYFFPADTILKPNEIRYFTGDEIKVTLNDAGDTVNLIDPLGQLADSVSYDSGKKGLSYARATERAFVWVSNPTPGLENIFPQPVIYPDNIKVNEVLPNPIGKDAVGEWVEISNQNSKPVDLSNWQLDDEEGGSKPYTIAPDTKIEPNSLIVFPRTQTGLALNNGGDSVRILKPNGILADQVDYLKSVTGESYALIDNNWVWTNRPTPGTSNLPSEVIIQEKKSKKVKKYKKATKKFSSKQVKKDIVLAENIENETQSPKIVHKVYPLILYPDIHGQVRGVSTKRKSLSLISLDIFAIIVFLTLLITNIWLNIKHSKNYS